ncbi:MAG: protein translocase subunit SecF [bacterium]|nr:protein translocase subunit SecF [bacterium]
MKIFKKDPNFDFMGKRLYAFGISGLLIFAGLFLFLTKGFNQGIDFTGGTMIEVSFKDDVSVDTLRKSLRDVGLSKSMIQRIGEENKFFIKTTLMFDESTEDGENSEKKKVEPAVGSGHVGFTALIKDALMSDEEKELNTKKLDLNDASEKRIVNFFVSKGVEEEIASDTAKKLIDLTIQNPKGLITDFSEIETLDLKQQVKPILKEDTFLGSFTFLSTESVGPKVGHDLRGKVTRAAVYALLGMLIYIGFRFRVIYGIAAVVTLIHDVLLTLFFLLLFGVEISLPVVAAILTIVGYSLNDTIVIFDRVRDNVKLMRREEAGKILNRSINQTLSRTIVTSGTTLCTVFSLFFFGGEVIHSFSFTLLIGVMLGTYSSIFQSCAWLKIWEKKLLGRKKT